MRHAAAELCLLVSQGAHDRIRQALHLAADNCRRSAWRQREVWTVGVERELDRTTTEGGKLDRIGLRESKRDWIGLDWRLRW